MGFSRYDERGQEGNSEGRKQERGIRWIVLLTTQFTAGCGLEEGTLGVYGRNPAAIVSASCSAKLRPGHNPGHVRCAI